MKTKTYKYDDLPTDELKSDARKWWIDCEREDPAFKNEHDKSCIAAVKAAASGVSADDLEKFRLCGPTGYCADHLMFDNYKAGMTAKDITTFYRKAWKAEMKERLSNVEQIAENIRSNEYDFKIQAVIA